MEKFWQWLMRMDARAIFITTLALLAGVVLWRTCKAAIFGGGATAAENSAESSAGAQRADYKPLGLISEIDRQFAPQTLILPLNPFQPTFSQIVDSFIQSQFVGGTEPVVQADRPPLVWDNELKRFVPADPNHPSHPRNQHNHGQNQQVGGHHQVRVESSQEEEPPPTLRIGGMMQRPDSICAAYFKHSKLGGRFLVPGDSFAGVKLLSVSAANVTVILPNGAKMTIPHGSPPIILR